MPSSTEVTTTNSSLLSCNPQESIEVLDADRFFWSYTEEPHKTRRQAIIKAHPEVFPAHLSTQVIAAD